MSVVRHNPGPARAFPQFTTCTGCGYGELLKRTGIEFLPGVHPDD